MNDLENLICWKNNNFIYLKEAGPSLLDFGFIHSDATYDVASCIDNKFVNLDLHIKRFKESCAYWNLEFIDNIESIANKLLVNNDLKTAFIWMISWRGYPDSGNPRDLTAKCHQVVYVKPYYNFLNKDKVSICVSDQKRTNTYNQKYKNFAWQDLTKAQFYANKKGYDSAVCLDNNDYITEGPGFNVCFLKNNIFYTPKENVLQGITVQTKDPTYINIDLNFAYNAEKAFVCSTAGGFTEISNFNGKIYG